MSKFRIDRFLTLFLFDPLIKMRNGNYGTSRSQVSILMYHSISNDVFKGKRRHPYYETNTSPDSFKQQMGYLKRENFTVLALSEFNKEIFQNNAKKVIITFDDGYFDNFQTAFPILQQFGFVASIFLPTKYIGNKRKKFNGKKCLTWSEIREMRKHGIQFGSHTVSHPKLVSLAPRAIKEELLFSKMEIDNNLDEKVNSFSYPFAFPEGKNEFKRLFLNKLKECGYIHSLTTNIGLNKKNFNPYLLKRIPINNFDDKIFFAAKLRGAYSWLNKPQKGFKIISRN